MELILIVVIVAVVAIMVFWFIGMYNRLVRKRVSVDNAFSQIDVQLKRRYDLIPNLVETVKGYASHEREALEAVIQARSRASAVAGDAQHAAEKAQAESFLTQSLGRLFALSEAYPDLKANTNFMQLQEELASTENRIGFARQHYNDSVAQYDKLRQMFPTNIVASMFNFEKRDYFNIEAPQEREAPRVAFK